LPELERSLILGLAAGNRFKSLEMGMKTNPASAVRRIERNALLAGLPSAERARFSDDLELVPLTLGQVLYESGQTMT
jgi:hypothetical protein